jgi:glycine/D-amino acid oxidase-like deaminating enzyme
MARAASALYDGIKDDAPVPFRLDPSRIGFLLVAGDTEDERNAGREESDAAGVCGVTVEDLKADRIAELEPGLTQDLTEGWLLDDGRRLDPAALTVSLALMARAQGADIRTHVTTRALLSSGDRVRGVISDEGPLHTDTVLVAAGPWTSSLLRPLGIHLPVTGARGWLVHVAPGKPVISRLVGRAGWHIPPSAEPILPPSAQDVADRLPRADTGVLVQPNPDGTILVGGSRQKVVTPEPEDPSVPQRLLREAIRLVPSLAEAIVLGAWWGIRPMTPDGRPIVGLVTDGLMVAAGHGGLGVILAGGTAELLAATLLGEPLPFEAEPFSPQRPI